MKAELLKPLIVVALLQVVGVVFAWGGNVHVLSVPFELLLIPSVVVAYFVDPQRGSPVYHVLLITAAAMNVVLVGLYWSWRLRRFDKVR